jgi:hypothetical protein
MTKKERELINRRLAFKVRVGELLQDTNLSYIDIGKTVGRTHQRVAQIRKELGFPRRHGGYHNTPVVLDTPTTQEKNQ